MKEKLRTWLAGVGSAFPSAFSPYWRALSLITLEAVQQAVGSLERELRLGS